MAQANGKKRILIVEDDESISLGLRMNLEAEGYEVQVAIDGDDGLAREHWGVFDQMKMMQQLGAVPPPDAPPA